MNKFSKVAIIGAGAVGTATANSILIKGVASEIVLIDINKDKAMGEVIDMQHSIVFQSSNVKLKAGDYADCKDCDVVILTVAAPMDGILPNRVLLRDKTANILKIVVPQIVESGFNGIFIVVSNPVDSMTQLVKELSGFDKSKVIGSGTILESARFKFIISEMMNVNLNSIDAYVLGEHGDAMVIPWSHITVGGKNILEIVKDNPEKYKNFSKDEIFEQVRVAGHVVLKSKGNTQFGIASSVCAIVTAILQDECKTYPVSAYLEGEYGLEGVYCGVPAVIGKDGIVDIGVYNLEENDFEAIQNAGKVIKDTFNSIEK